MKVTKTNDAENIRVIAVELGAEDDGEARFLAAVMEVFERGNGKIEANTGLDNFVCVPRTRG